MEDFPVVDNNKFVVVRADYKTGKVLDKDFNRVTSDSIEVFTVFDSFNDALNYCESSHIKGEVEFVIYDYNQKVLKYIR